MTATSSLSVPVVSADHRQKKGFGRWVVLAILLVFLAGTLFPFFLAAFNAIKTPSDYAANGPLAFPQTFDLTALKNFWDTVNFPRKLFNSILISGCTAILAVVLSLLNAYAIGIGRVRGGQRSEEHTSELQSRP